jgi:hypothetical protein
MSAALRRAIACAAVFAAACSAPSATAPNGASSAEPEMVNVFGPASLLEPPASSASAAPAAPTREAGRDTSPAASAASLALPSAQPAPVAPAPPPLDLVDGPLPQALAGGAELVRAEKWSKAKTSLAQAVAAVDAAGVPDDVAVAHALLGRASAGAGDLAGAKKAYAAALAAADAADPVVANDADEARRAVRVARLALVRGEAMFSRAEEKRRLAAAKKAPSIGALRDQTAVTKFTHDKLAPWLVERMKLMNDAESAYQGVLQVKPFPPPAWVVASSRQVAGMWEAFVDEVNKTPIPAEWQGEGEINHVKKSEIRRLFREALDGTMAPYRDRVRQGYRMCSDHAKRFSVTTADAAACDDWLAKHPAPPP